MKTIAIWNLQSDSVDWISHFEILMKFHLDFLHGACIQWKAHPWSFACKITVRMAAQTAFSMSKIICCTAGIEGSKEDVLALCRSRSFSFPTLTQTTEALVWRGYPCWERRSRSAAGWRDACPAQKYRQCTTLGPGQGTPVAVRLQRLDVSSRILVCLRAGTHQECSPCLNRTVSLWGLLVFWCWLALLLYTQASVSTGRGHLASLPIAPLQQWWMLVRRYRQPPWPWPWQWCWLLTPHQLLLGGCGHLNWSGKHCLHFQSRLRLNNSGDVWGRPSLKFNWLNPQATGTDHIYGHWQIPASWMHNVMTWIRELMKMASLLF